MADEKPHQCKFKEEGDDLEKAHYDDIRNGIPEYIEFWQEYIGFRSGPRGREPYRVVPVGNVAGNVRDGLDNWHWATCETHYSFLHHWLEARKELEWLAERLYKAPSLDVPEWCEAHLRAFESGLMRVGNARNMIVRLWGLLWQVRNNRSEYFYSKRDNKWDKAKEGYLKEVLGQEGYDSLYTLVLTRNYVVHSASPVIYANDTPERCGQPMVPFLNKEESFQGWRYEYKGALPTERLLKFSFDTLTSVFRNSEYRLFQEVQDVLKTCSVTLDWGEADGSVIPSLEKRMDQVEGSERALPICPVCKTELRKKTKIALCPPCSDSSSAQRDIWLIKLDSPKIADGAVRNLARRFRELYCPNCGYEE